MRKPLQQQRQNFCQYLRKPGALLCLMLGLILGLTACANTASQTTSQTTSEATDIAETLDSLHNRAAAADFDGYFALYAEDAVFMGTDRTEVWPLVDFKAYTKPHFSKGNGWTYVPTERQVHINAGTAWFEERLQNEKYGEVRGTGVLVRTAAGWKVAQYNLTLPLPNELFSEIARQVIDYYATD